MCGAISDDEFHFDDIFNGKSLVKVQSLFYYSTILTWGVYFIDLGARVNSESNLTWRPQWNLAQATTSHWTCYITRDAAWAGLGWAGPGWAGLVWDTGEMEIAWCVGMPGHVTTCLMHAACCMLQCGTIRLLQEAVKQCEWTLQLLVASGVGWHFGKVSSKFNECASTCWNVITNILISEASEPLSAATGLQEPQSLNRNWILSLHAGNPCSSAQLMGPPSHYSMPATLHSRCWDTAGDVWRRSRLTSPRSWARNTTIASDSYGYWCFIGNW